MLDSLLDDLPWLWFGTVVVGSCLAELLWCGVVVLRAADLDYDPGRCADRRPKINLPKALRRRVSWPRVGVPLFLLCAGLFAVQHLWMSFQTYALISIGWFLTAPLRKFLGIAASRRLYAVRRGHSRGAGFWANVRDYYAAGFRMPARPEDRLWFIGRFRWLNRFQALWYVLQVYRFWGICAAAVSSLAWPVASAFAIFYHLEGVGQRDYLCPWWRFDRDLSWQEPTDYVPVPVNS